MADNTEEQNPPELSKKVYIVVSRYNEDLKWLLQYPFTEFEYIVYNKGDNSNFVKRNVKKIINIHNVGREGHTYLYHIIENYHDLPELIVFLPGSVNNHNKIDKAKDILTRILKSDLTKAYFKGLKYKCLYSQCKYFKLDTYSSSDTKNYLKNSEKYLQRCVLRPYGKWYKHFFGNIRTHWFTSNGIFSLDTRDIKQHPKEKYERLIQTLERSSNPEAGHYMERSWGAVFFPLRYTEKIHE